MLIFLDKRPQINKIPRIYEPIYSPMNNRQWKSNRLVLKKICFNFTYNNYKTPELLSINKVSFKSTGTVESGSEQLQNVVAKIDSYFGVAGQ